MKTVSLDKFRIEDKIALITGGAGLLGVMHAEAILEGGGVPVLLDINKKTVEEKAKYLSEYYEREVFFEKLDITSLSDIEAVNKKLMNKFGHIDILINNAANDPKVVSKPVDKPWSRFENFQEDIWDKDLAVGLKGAFFCCRIFGNEMAIQKSGVILNISSDLGIIAPDQRIYQIDNVSDNMQPVKPVTYSVIKHGLIGLTKYLATYWAKEGVRVNAICPGGVYNNQPEDFVEKLTNLIPMARMAKPDEYKSSVLYLVSDASSYMTGSTVIIDGGRTCW